MPPLPDNNLTLFTEHLLCGGNKNDTASAFSLRETDKEMALQFTVRRGSGRPNEALAQCWPAGALVHIVSHRTRPTEALPLAALQWKGNGRESPGKSGTCNKTIRPGNYICQVCSEPTGQEESHDPPSYQEDPAVTCSLIHLSAAFPSCLPASLPAELPGITSQQTP